MYAWHRICPDEKTLIKYLKDELKVEYKGVGFYLDEKNTMLVTVEDSKGERGTTSNPGNDKPRFALKPEKDSRYNVYVFNVPFERTVFALTCRTAVDNRP